MAYISKIKVPGVDAAYLIKDNEGRLMIAPEYVPGKSYVDGDYYVNEGKLYVVRTTESGTTGIETTVSKELQSIKQSIAGAMHYIGVTSTLIYDGDEEHTTLEPTTTGSLTKTSGFVAGDVVLAPASDKTAEKYYEYVWNGNMWNEFGSTKAIGKMAYANSASGSTSITYNKPVYTGGTVEVNDYSEGESKYLNKNTVVSTVDVSGTTSASSVSKSVSKLGTTSVSVVDGTGVAVTNITTTQKGLATTSIFGVSGTGAAVTGVTSTNKRLGTTSIYGVQSKGVNVSEVTEGSTSIQVGATNTTKVVSGLGSTAAAAGQNPFVNATVDADECLSWIEKPLSNTEIREASKQEITVQNLTVKQITGVAKVASDSVTVATGTLVDKTVDGGAEVAIGVITTTDSFAKKAQTGTTVATGTLDDNKTGIITEVTSTMDSFAKKATDDVVVATGALDANGTGANVISDITITAVTGLVTGITSTNNTGVLVEGTSGETGAIKVLTGITSTAATKNVTLTKGADETHSIDVAITVNPDPRK